MKEKYKERLLTQAVIISGSMLLALGFWGIAFPQYLFTGDCVRIFDEEGQDITEEESKDKNLYCEISSAEPEQIEVKISILEWAKR